MPPAGLAAAIVDLLWAPRCAACDDDLATAADGDPPRRAFCAACADTLEPAAPRCPRCGVPFAAGGDHLCGRCLVAPPPFASLAARYAYGGAIATAISRFKYGPAPWLAAPLARLMPFALARPLAPDVVVPVPLHPRRLRARGYNQAALLAAPARRAIGAPVDTSLLRRVHDTPHQAGLDRRARLDALAGAFAARSGRALIGSRVLLVDDVATTTATVRAAALALLEAGACAVDVLCLARAG